MDCILDSTVVSCKTLDVTNGNKEKMASVLLKRGRMILKKRYDSRKHALRNTLFKATMSGWDSHKVKLEDVNTANQNELALPNNNLDTKASTPTLKEAIKLEDKLISGEEIELCPAYRIDSQRTECTMDEAVERLANENSKQSKISKGDSSKFYLNNFELDEVPHNSSDKSPIIAEDYPKLYITVTDTSDKDAMAKNSLLKNIRSIQNTNGDSYGINISNSRFFVPKDYIFSGVESAMNDLKFEVDPEMGRLLKLQRSYSSPQVNTSSLSLVNIEAGLSSLSNTAVSTEALTVPSDSMKQRTDTDLKNTKSLSDSSVCVRSKESNKDEQRQRLFLKQRESKPSEINYSISNETVSKSKTTAESQTRNQAESLDEFDNCSIRENEKKSQGTRHEDNKSSQLKACHLKEETTEREISCNNQLETAKHVIIDEDQITKSQGLDAMAGNREVFEESKISNSLNEKIEIKSSHDILSAPLMRRKSYPLLTPSEIAYKSKYTSFPIISLDTRGRVLNVQSEKETEISGPSKYFIDQQKQAGSSARSEQLQESKCSSPSETNRLNRIRFLQDSIQTNEDSSQKEKATSSESKLRATSEEPKISQNNADILGPDHPPPMGRTSSLREKFETIVEDVELRMLPGRRPQISESCDRKSFS